MVSPVCINVYIIKRTFKVKILTVVFKKGSNSNINSILEQRRPQ